jgi:hypothetical protein
MEDETMATAQMQSFDSRLSVLETEVKGIVGTQQSIINAVDRIGSKIDQKSTPQWSVYISAAAFLLTVLITIGAAWKAPIETSITKQDSDIRKLQDSIVSRTEHAEHWRWSEKEFDILRQRVTREHDQIEKRIDRLEAQRLGK